MLLPCPGLASRWACSCRSLEPTEMTSLFRPVAPQQPSSLAQAQKTCRSTCAGNSVSVLPAVADALDRLYSHA